TRSPSLVPCTTLFRSRRLRVCRNVEVGFVEHYDGLQFVVWVALAEAQRFRQELRYPEQDVLVVAKEAGVNHGQARAVRALVAARSEEHTSELQSRENL